jgi:hypothetical protein
LIDFRADAANAFDSTCVASESVSKDIDESDLQSEKHSEVIIQT